MRAALAGKVPAQVDDRVADELPWSVISHVAATVDLVQFDAAAGQPFIAGEYVGARGVAAEGDYRRMLEKEEGVADEACLARRDHAGLDGEAVGVGDAAEL